jgi:hypothetical protein
MVGVPQVVPVKITDKNKLFSTELSRLCWLQINLAREQESAEGWQ